MRSRRTTTCERPLDSEETVRELRACGNAGQLNDPRIRSPGFRSPRGLRWTARNLGFGNHEISRCGSEARVVIGVGSVLIVARHKPYATKANGIGRSNGFDKSNRRISRRMLYHSLFVLFTLFRRPLLHPHNS